MTSTLGFVLAAFLAFAPAPTGVEGARDLILLAEGRPIFLRLRVTTGDLPFDSSWLDSVRTLHACLDRDGDGKLTTTEAGADALAALVRLATGGAATLPRVELDVDPKDGVVSIEELAEALRPALGPFRVQIGRLDGSKRWTLGSFTSSRSSGLSTASFSRTSSAALRLSRSRLNWTMTTDVPE